MSTVFIGMPAYNGSRFIREAIESIRSQSHTDWKLFISDDCSTDDTALICGEFTKIDRRITYMRQPKNIGMFANFKYVLDQADTEYFMWAAQDDIREKDYLSVCVETLDRNVDLGLATTCLAAIDSYGRTLIEETELRKFSGKPVFGQVARYVLQPEILGKCNLMYGVYRTSAAKMTWEIYPQRYVWGQDYMFSLAIISHFAVYVDPQVLFKKRLGGFSSPTLLDNDKQESFTKLEYAQPKNHIFPFGRFGGYLKGHIEAVSGTPYALLVAALLMIRLPRSFLIYIRARNIWRYTKSKLFNK